MSTGYSARSAWFLTTQHTGNGGVFCSGTFVVCWSFGVRCTSLACSPVGLGWVLRSIEIYPWISTACGFTLVLRVPATARVGCSGRIDAVCPSNSCWMIRTSELWKAHPCQILPGLVSLCYIATSRSFVVVHLGCLTIPYRARRAHDTSTYIKQKPDRSKVRRA